MGVKKIGGPFLLGEVIHPNSLMAMFPTPYSCHLDAAENEVILVLQVA